MVSQFDFIEDFSSLGALLRRYLSGVQRLIPLEHAITKSTEHNPWFTEFHIKEMLEALSQNYLQPQKLHIWLSKYPHRLYSFEKEIGIVMAGNIPLVGYHDYLSVLASGRKASIKLSSKDPFLLPALHDLLCSFAPFWRQNVRFVTEVPENTDGLIATGSDATTSRFKRHFPHLPKIVRGHRISVAIVHEGITRSQIDALRSDMFLYFGLGCRSVVKLFVPQRFELKRLTIFEQLPHEASHTGFRNAYLSQKALLTLQHTPFIDGGFFLLQESNGWNPPISAFYYTRYTNINEVINHIQRHSNHIQCVVGEGVDIKKSVNFGSSQKPQLWDYADELDTIHLYDIQI